MTQKILSSGASAKQALQYCVSAGHRDLIEIIARSYKEKYNLELDPGLIVITNGSQQALDLISKITINDNDKIAFESPTYLAAIHNLSFYRRNFAELEPEPDGPSVKNLDKIKDAKLLCSVPNFQNPGGVTWSNQKRKEIAEFCDKNDILLIEDDSYGEIRFSRARKKPLKCFGKHVIILGFFQRFLLRACAWVGWSLSTRSIIKKSFRQNNPRI